MTPSGIEPATFRFVAQHLNHCAAAYCVEYWGLFRTKDTVLNKTPLYEKRTLIILCVVCETDLLMTSNASHLQTYISVLYTREAIEFSFSCVTATE